MDSDDPNATAEGGLGLDDADPDEIALTRAVLHALRGWMVEGRTVVITRDTHTHEVRIETGDLPDEEVSLTDRFSWPDFMEYESPRDCEISAHCPGPGSSITGPRSGSRSGSRSGPSSRRRRLRR